MRTPQTQPICSPQVPLSQQDCMPGEVTQAAPNTSLKGDDELKEKLKKRRCCMELLAWSSPSVTAGWKGRGCSAGGMQAQCCSCSCSALQLPPPSLHASNMPAAAPPPPASNEEQHRATTDTMVHSTLPSPEPSILLEPHAALLSPSLVLQAKPLLHAPIAATVLRFCLPRPRKSPPPAQPNNSSQEGLGGFFFPL